MRPIRNLIGLFVGLTFLTAIVSAISAAIAKQRLVSRGGELDDEIDLVTIYTGQDFTSRAASFRGGSLLTWYGGGTVDLRAATIDPSGATLRIRTIFGGLRLVVPASWRVVPRMTPIFGGVGDGRDSTLVDDLGPTLVLDGFALFGGVGIVSEAPDLDGAESGTDAAADMAAGAAEAAPSPA